LNYRGYGKSDGTPSFKTQFKDNTNFLNFIIEKDHQKPKIMIGYSIGTIAASYLASENNLDELYLLAPFSNAEETISYLKKGKTKGLKSIFRPFIKITAEEHLLKISNTEKVKNYTGKLTILHALDDSVLPYKMGKELYEISPSSKKELITIENGGHGSVFYKKNWDRVIEMIKS
jgi:pimeloyl-ACP methyl ester carboxylesterase